RQHLIARINMVRLFDKVNIDRLLNKSRYMLINGMHYFSTSFSYPFGRCTCQFQASSIIFVMEVRVGCQPNIRFAFSEEAISIPGSPARRSPVFAGISLPVTFLAVSIISFTENP